MSHVPENEFPVFEVARQSAANMEYMGTKPKFWLDHPELGSSLFKLARPNTGEDWSEKIAEQLALALGLPCARYELAALDGEAGVITPTLLPSGFSMRHGNELLREQVEDYPSSGTIRNFGLSQHTVQVVMDSLEKCQVALPPPEKWKPVDGVTTAQELFVGYLMLDAWIGNTDRHHENWAVIEPFAHHADKAASRYLAPTYDHASCLGCHISDRERNERLTTRDRQRTVDAYVEKAKSAFFLGAEQSNPMKTREAFHEAAQSCQEASVRWLRQLEAIEDIAIDRLFTRIPPTRISLIAWQFAREMLRINRKKLLETK